jgi:molybdate transport system substrate-binding protein
MHVKIFFLEGTMTRMRKVLGIVSGLLLCLGVAGPAAAATDITVFAAASTTNALTEIAKIYEGGGSGKVALSFASSSTLAKQIENGAPADVFLSANKEWMDYLDGKKLLEAGSRAELLGNRIVFIVPKASAVQSVTVSPRLDLAALLGKDGLLSVGDPAHVPVGQYAKAALENLKLWPQVEKRIAPAKDVRAGLALVERAESPLGIVYASDAVISDKVRVVGAFPVDSHPNIDYPVAALKTSNNAAALNFMKFMRTPQAKEIWAKYGFEVK